MASGIDPMDPWRCVVLMPFPTHVSLQCQVALREVGTKRSPVGFAASRTVRSTYRFSGSVRAGSRLLLHPPYGELAVDKVTIKAAIRILSVCRL